MIKISILLTLLLHLLCIKTTILAEVCSEYLTYISNGTTDKVELLGRIEIPSVSENDDFFLRVAFNADEFVKQLIELHLARTIKESVRAVQKGNSLLYNIYFTKVSGESIPRVTAIWFNNRQYCPGRKFRICLKDNKCPEDRGLMAVMAQETRWHYVFMVQEIMEKLSQNIFFNTFKLRKTKL